MTGKGGDYEGWILRMIDKAEDIIFSYSQTDWLKFCAEKIEEQTGQGITRSQIDALLENRNRAFDLPEQIGITVNRETRYRDAKGRWSKEPTDRAYTSVVMRGEGSKFISRTKATQLVRDEISALGVRKKEKDYS